jgi:hypothetical protein
MPTKNKKLSVRTLQVYIQTLTDAVKLYASQPYTPKRMYTAVATNGQVCYCAAGAIGASYRHWKCDLLPSGMPSDGDSVALSDRLCRPGMKARAYRDGMSLYEVNDAYGPETSLSVMVDSLEHWQRRLKKALKAQKETKP